MNAPDVNGVSPTGIKPDGTGNAALISNLESLNRSFAFFEPTPEEIFVDGFESGDITQWSRSVPD